MLLADLGTLGHPDQSLEVVEHTFYFYYRGWCLAVCDFTVDVFAVEGMPGYHKQGAWQPHIQLVLDVSFEL